MDGKVPLIDLHRHLEGCVRPSTIIELGLQRDLPLPAWSVEELRPYVQVAGPVPGVMAFIAKFDLMQLCMTDYDAIRRITRECVEDACAEGLDYLELRFSPVFMAEKHDLDLDGVVEAVCDGLQDAVRVHPIRANLIGIMSRTYGPERCWEELEAVLRGRDRGVIAVDLAGDEIAYPGQLFTRHFQRARESGMRITVHAGEPTSAAQVRQAIVELGAERIGHGIRAVDDPAVMDLVAREGVGLENCLSTNVQCGLVSSYAEHPLPVFLRRGLLVTLNTDCTTISGSDLKSEYRLAEEELALSEEELNQLRLNAGRVAFLTDEERADLMRGTSAGDLGGAADPV